MRSDPVPLACCMALVLVIAGESLFIAGVLHDVTKLQSIHKVVDLSRDVPCWSAIKDTLDSPNSNTSRKELIKLVVGPCYVTQHACEVDWQARNPAHDRWDWCFDLALDPSDWWF